MREATTELREELAEAGLPAAHAEMIASIGESNRDNPLGAWRVMCRDVLRPDHPFAAHLAAHRALFSNWDAANGPAPVWIPDPNEVSRTNLAALRGDRGIDDYQSLHRWSVESRFEFWREMIARLDIRFIDQPARIVDDEREIESPRWLPGASLNIADSCFRGQSDRVAIIHASEDGALDPMTLGELEALTNRVANGLREQGFEPETSIAIDMPMTAESVAIYLGIVRAGCTVVSIADSFAANEIATRLRIAGARAIFTQDALARAGKTLPLYEKVVAAKAPRAIVLASDARSSGRRQLRDGDVWWNDFLSDNDSFDSTPCRPHDHTNILFSSGTTGDPKAIPWTHTTPIKCTADGWLHHDIRPGDVVAWPTNLGWMMGPWLIYASLINHATIALYGGPPNTRGFCEFVQNARINMLGVVPSLVKSWRENDLTNGIDWSSVRCFSSTGECSNAEDMFWLMSRAGYKPVIEYCGGTEIGGGYITGTMIQPAAPATFTTPALGLDLVIVDDSGREAESGELFLSPPSIGLSTELLNRDHHEVYFHDTPRGPGGELLRRHGDEMRRLGGGYFQALGRADDTMNLGGIKISSAEIERVLNQLPGVRETAAVALPPPGGGPDRLIIFSVLEADSPGADSADDLKPAMQELIRRDLNPLFRVHEVRVIDALPRTASNKVMRRMLREECMDKAAG